MILGRKKAKVNPANKPAKARKTPDKNLLPLLVVLRSSRRRKIPQTIPTMINIVVISQRIEFLKLK